MNLIKKIINISFIVYIVIGYPLLNAYFFEITSRVFLIFICISLIIFNYKQIGNMFSFRNKNILYNVILLIFFYYVISLLIFTIFNSNLKLFFTISLNGIFPLVVFFVFYKNSSTKYTINTVIYSVLLVVILGFLTYPQFNLSSIYFPNIRVRSQWRMASFYGSTSFGYMSQFCFALVLFKYKGKFREVLLGIFFLASFFSFQRGSWAGIIIALIFYYINFKKIHFRQIIIILICILIFIYTIPMVDKYIINEDLQRYMQIRINQFNFNDVWEGRKEAQKIYINYNSLFNILFGEGFGKYALQNRGPIRDQSDAPYYRIFNEGGIIGSILFISFILIYLYKSFVYKNIFSLYLFFQLLINMIGTEILETYPGNMIFYIFLSMIASEIFNSKYKKITNLK